VELTKKCSVKESILLAVAAKKSFLSLFHPGATFRTPLLTRHTLDHALLQNLLAYCTEQTVLQKIHLKILVFAFNFQGDF